MTTWAWIYLSILTAVVLLNAGLTIGVMRLVGAQTLRQGSAAPVEGPPHEALVRVDGLNTDRAAIVAFLSPNCTACSAIVPHLEAMDAEEDAPEIMAIVAGPSEAQARTYARDLKLRNVRTDLTRLMEEWNVERVPFFVAVDTASRVHSHGVLSNGHQLRDVLGDLKDLLLVDPPAVDANAGIDSRDSADKERLNG